MFGLFLTSSLVILMAMTLDLSNINVARSEMRRAADAAALAAGWQLFDDRVARTMDAQIQPNIYLAASTVALENPISGEGPMLDNVGGDVQLGYWTSANPSQFDTSNPSRANAVRVTLRREDAVNGKIPLFFSKVLGTEGQSLTVTSTAAMFTSICGFSRPATDDQYIEILPIALDLPTWESMVAGSTADDFHADGAAISSGSDGICECNLYPQGTGSPGNRGTVDIGGRNNSTADLSRQILRGISRQDFDELGKPLKFDNSGRLELNGDTGISAGIKDELASIIGQTRIIPIYESVTGNGNNATYTIVRFEGVRILDVKLTGSKNQKRLMVQPTMTLARGAIVADAGIASSQYLYTPVMLVQ